MGRRFTFRLQPVLEQRERAERDQQLKVAAIEGKRVEIEAALRDAEERLMGARRELRASLGEGGPGAVSIDAVRLHMSGGLHQTLRARQLALELSGVLSRLQRERQALGQLAAERKAVELLKRKRREEHDRELARREAAELDELTVMRHARTDTGAHGSRS